ncbi:BaiN/RdsA family NAD(P)/FAD-dependent oxidoreductase [Maricaulis sp. CAU 1757]
MTDSATKNIAIIGAGPAGLIAAEYLSGQGHGVEVFERMPTPGRKFLMAGRGGLNLTHAEAREDFITRYREAADWLTPMIEAFPPDALRAWADELGQDTFVGSSGRVFPRAMKASPLLRAWRSRLEARGVRLHLRHHWAGWPRPGVLRFDTLDGLIEQEFEAVLLALGGASWPRLGSDGGWATRLRERDVAVRPFEASNTGIEIAWTKHVKSLAGTPLKTVALRFREEVVMGDLMLTEYGMEGGPVYALSAPVREALATGPVPLQLDLKPHVSTEGVTYTLEKAGEGASTANLLRKAGLGPAAVNVLRDCVPAVPRGPEVLASLIKSVPLEVTGQRGLDRAISSAGGVARDAVDDGLMLKALPGVFVAGEMLDWDAPTGGYLLQASFASGMWAAHGLQAWLAKGEN